MRLRFAMVDSVVVEYVGEVATLAEMRDASPIPWCFHKEAENRFGFALRHTTAAIIGIETGS